MTMVADRNGTPAQQVRAKAGWMRAEDRAAAHIAGRCAHCEFFAVPGNGQRNCSQMGHQTLRTAVCRWGRDRKTNAPLWKIKRADT